MRPDVVHQVHQRELIEQVGLVQMDAVAQMLDPLEAFGARASDHAVDFVSFVQQERSQVRPILAGDPGD